MAARGDGDAGAEMSEARIGAYRTLAADLGIPLLDTSYLSPEAGTAQVLAMMPALPG
ncbi:hypothetical protein MPOCJGCO_4130 [Methylobacterium trifolii]|uniref:Uncharacterized protein n=1 Tax=Methylobacterium trifolii TaxID=1003092 RepID=A0ABQ4U6H1_9HYPH|nr:hypothetical protein MPOCJGCO_4130 [Methylobacterium trifolii]